VSTGLLFGVGVLVTVLVSIGLALPIYGAILDGRDQAARREGAEIRALSEKRSGRRPAA
jgi:hypothetical protein